MPAATNRFVELALVAGFLVVCAAAQNTPAPTPQSPSSASPSSSSKPHRGSHHLQVSNDDSPVESPELSQAEAAIEKQDFATAEPLLQKATEKDAKSYVAWFDLGFTENALGNLDASIAAYRKSVAAKPDVFESNLNLGLQLAKTGSEDAKVFLRAATKLKPTGDPAEGKYRAWMALGRALEKTDPDDAIGAYRQAGTFEPKEAEPHLAAGVLLEQEHEASDAEKEYKAALAATPANSDAVVALANLYMHGRRFSDAEEYLRKLLVERPDSGPVEIQLGRVLAAEGNYDEAIAALQKGIKLAPQDEDAQRDLAEIYVTAGKNDLAEAAYRTLASAHPKDADLHQRLGRALLREKKFKEAQPEFTTSISLQPNVGEVYGDLAFVAAENEQYPLVLKALDARAKLLPEIPMTYFLRASASDHLHDFKTAAANYHLFLKTAGGKYPDYEWKAKHRLVTIEPKK